MEEVCDMKKLVSLLIIFSLMMLCINAVAAEKIEKLWERACEVPAGGDAVTSMAVWSEGDVLATIDRNAEANAIKLFNSVSGLREEFTEQLDMTGVPTAVNSIYSGDFSEDGTFFACSLSDVSGADLEVFYWADIDSAPVKILDNAYYGYRLGDALDVIGQVSDNSVSIMIGGNSASSQPLVITYPGSTWTSASLSNTVQAQDICQVSSGQFYATYAGGDIVRYNADGSVDATLVTGAENQTSVAVDEANGFLFSVGYAATSINTNHLKVYDLATGTLLASGSGDPINVNSALGANGTSAVEVVEKAGGTYVFAMSENNGCARYSYSTNLLVASSGGDFTTIQGAISSYCTGGANAGAVKPLLIEISTNGSPYDEAISLDQSATGSGDIVGDLILKGVGPSKPIVKVQNGGGIGGDDGLPILQDAANVILKNLVICPSQSGTTLTDDLIAMTESSANTTMNWYEIYGCILTDINTSGAPMITATSQALDEPPATRGSEMVDGDSLFRTQASSSLSYFMEQSVVYYNPHLSYMIVGGDADAEIRLHNCIVSQSRPAAIYSVSYDTQHALIITGDDQTNGILSGNTINCSALYEFNRREFYYGSGIDTRGSSAKLVVILKNAIVHTTQNNLNCNGINTIGDGLGQNTDIYKIHDVIFDVTGNGAIRDEFVYDAANATDIRRCTLKAINECIYIENTSAASTSISVIDSIFADATGAIRTTCSNAVTVSLTNCALPGDGPNAIGSIAIADGSGVAPNLTETNCIYTDPEFTSTDPLLGTYLDPVGAAYAGAALGDDLSGDDLGGGANYAGADNVEAWSIME